MNCIINAWGQHESELRGFLKRQLSGDQETAEDLLQETFLRALRQGAKFCDLENPRAWLFRVARSRLADHARRAHIRLTHPLEEEHLEHSETPDEPAAVVSLDACLPVALASLSATDRHVVEHCDLEGMSQVDYAKDNGLGLSSVKSRVQRARKRLKQALDERCGIRYDESGQVCCHTCPPSESES